MFFNKMSVILFFMSFKIHLLLDHVTLDVCLLLPWTYFLQLKWCWPFWIYHSDILCLAMYIMSSTSNPKLPCPECNIFTALVKLPFPPILYYINCDSFQLPFFFPTACNRSASSTLIVERSPKTEWSEPTYKVCHLISQEGVFISRCAALPPCVIYPSNSEWKKILG